MKIYIILFIVGSLIHSCESQDVSRYQDVLGKVKNECEIIKEKLDLKEQCEIEFSTKVVGINITPFHNVIDSLSLIDKNEDDDSFDVANLFDIENHIEPYEDLSLRKLVNEELNYNVKLYCSNTYNGLMTCEAVEKDRLNPNNELLFGRSILFLFKITKSNEVKKLSSVVLHNN